MSAPCKDYGSTISVLACFGETIAALRRAKPAKGLGRVKTRTCCGAVEWRSQASDVLSFSREARLSAPTDAQAKKSRKLRDSCASRTRVTSCDSCYRVSSGG